MESRVFSKNILKGGLFSLKIFFREVLMPMNELYRKLTHDLDKITMMRRIFTQRAATRDGICLGQSRVLEYIRRNPNCSQKDVADFMEVSPPSVAVMVKRMVRDELIQKTSDAKDLRQNKLTITPKGITTVKRIFGNNRNPFFRPPIVMLIFYTSF